MFSNPVALKGAFMYYLDADPTRMNNTLIAQSLIIIALCAAINEYLAKGFKLKDTNLMPRVMG